MAPKKRARKAATAASEPVDIESSSGEEDAQPAAGTSSTNPDPARQKLGELRRRAECPVCFDIYDDPRSLPACAHTLCFKCAKQLIQDSRLVCPICRAVSGLAGAGGAVKELPRNSTVAGFVELLQHDQQQGAAERASCGNCGATAAEVTCGRCEVHLCAVCSATIHKMRAFKQHDVQPYRPGASASALSRAFTCPAHAGEPLRYCKEKRVEACLQCISAGDHAGHAHTSIAEGAAALAAELAAALEARKADISAVEVLQSRQEKVVERVVGNGVSAKRAADVRAKELHASVDVHHANWLAALETWERSAVEAALQQLKSIRAAGQQLKEAVEFGASLSVADRLRAVRLQPTALARLAAAARGGQFPRVMEPKGVSFDPSGVELTVSGGGPVKDDASNGKARLEVPWKPELEPGACYVSDIVYCDGWPWRLIVYPKGQGDAKGTHVSMFLGIAQTLPDGFAIKMQNFSISVGARKWVAGAQSLKSHSNCGWIKLMPIDEFATTHVKEGKFVAEIAVENAQLVQQ